MDSAQSMRRKARGLRLRLAAVACIAGVAVSALVGAAPATAATASGPCEFAVLISVRGTSADPGSGLAHSNRVWTSGGDGPQLSVLANSLKAEDFPVYFESLNYPATAVNYESSVSTGAITLVNELNWLATACGNFLPAVILAGHSQGAQVISDALGHAQWPNGPALTDRAKEMVRAVTFYGDPQYASTDTWNAPGSPGGNGAFQRNLQVKNELSTFRYWGWTQGSSNPNPDWQTKIRSYCAVGDFYCQANPGDSSFTIHNSYKTSMVPLSANWIRYMLTSTS